MPTLAIIMGLPASGKSTYCKNEMKDYVRVCPDTIRLALHGQQFAPNAEPLVWATAEIMARTLLIDGYNVIIDATNTTKKRREMWVKLAEEFDEKLYIIVIKRDINKCKEWNKKRENPVPDEIIDRMYKQWESPTEDEGMMILI